MCNLVMVEYKIEVLCVQRAQLGRETKFKVADNRNPVYVLLAGRQRQSGQGLAGQSLATQGKE